jgi:hypothetical protein
MWWKRKYVIGEVHMDGSRTETFAAPFLAGRFSAVTSRLLNRPFAPANVLIGQNQRARQAYDLPFLAHQT